MFLGFRVAAISAPTSQTFDCMPTNVWDGDGPVWSEEGPRIRLAGIATRELVGSCSPGHPCPDADAISVRDALVALVGRPIGMGRQDHILVDDPTMSCVSTGYAGGNRLERGVFRRALAMFRAPSFAVAGLHAAKVTGRYECR